LNDKIRLITDYCIEFSVWNMDGLDLIQKVNVFPSLATRIFSPQSLSQSGGMEFQGKDGNGDYASISGEQDNISGNGTLKPSSVLSIYAGRHTPNGGFAIRK
jgi:uncharacterized membrane protein